MAIEDILKGVFPAQSITTDLASKGVLGLGPMGMGDLGTNQMLLGLLAPQFLGGMGQQEQEQEDPYADWRPDQFLSQGGIQGQQSPAQGQQGSPQGQQMDPLSLLDQNINRRFGM